MLFTDVDKSCPSPEFLMWQNYTSSNAIHENNIRELFFRIFSSVNDPYSTWCVLKKVCTFIPCSLITGVY